MLTMTTLLRLFISLAVGVLITFGLLWLMQRMVSGDVGQSRINQERPLIQFVRLKKKPETQIKHRPAPEKPPLPLKSPPPSIPEQRTKKTTLTTQIPDIKIETPKTSFAFGSSFLGPVMSGPVDRDFIPLSLMPPHYPYRALRRGIEGWVKVSFLITKQGKVKDVLLIDSKPSGIFDQAALEAVSRWTFKPRIHEGQKVATRAEQTVKFQLKKTK